MRKKKLLICGVSGFIGRNMAEAFSKDASFDIYGTYLKTRPKGCSGIKLISCDLTSRAEVDRLIKDKDIVIQAAATTSGSKEILGRPCHHVTDNAVMNSLIFRAAHEHDVSQVVFFSCSIMYQSSSRAVKETDFNPAQDIYAPYFGAGWTKVYLEKMCEFYARLGRTKYTVLRHSNIYGPFDKFDLNRSHVFGATVTKVLAAKNKGEIIVWGDGTEERDLLYISDLVDFVRRAIKIQKTPFELVNVGYGLPISLKKLVEKIIACSGKRLAIRHDLSKPTIKTRLYLDISRAKRIFGWSPSVSLDEGTKKTISWHRANFNTHK